MTGPEILINDIAPVIVGTADGIDVVGTLVGTIEGSNVGASVMKTSQEQKKYFEIP